MARNVDATMLEEEGLQGLLRRVVARDEGARSQLVRDYYPRVRGIVHRELQKDFRKQHRWILPLFSTRDVVQDVFAQVINDLDECAFDDEGGLIAYLSTVVRHRLLDAVRYHEAKRRDSRRNVSPDDDGTGEIDTTADPTPAMAASLVEQAAVLREVLESFRDRQRAMLEMRLVDEMPFPAIASKLGYASAETVRRAFLDAKAKLLVRLRSRGVRAES